jgi:hypothetical protein
MRVTLRLRLTLLYGLVFIAAGAGLLAVTYGLFKHNQASGSQTLSARGIQFTLPAGATIEGRGPGFAVSQKTVTPSPDARTTISKSRASGGTTTNFTRTPAGSILKKIRSSGQAQLLFLAARANAKLRTQQSNDASSLLEWSAIALGLVALLSIGLAWWLAGRALRPLRTMNARAREISAESLHQRLGVDERRDELGELATTFDALLARLESSFDSQRRFVANASHELRTPITLERTLVEVAMADPDASVESLRRVCERVVSSTEEQERLLDALLTLARSEAGVGAGESVDIAVIAEDALLARESQLAGIAVESSLESAAVVGDRALLERLIANLVDNAIVHNGGEARWISVSTFSDADGVPGLRIANGGEMIDPDRVDELFEPFQRGVGERLGSDGGHGLGLGLSIVRAVAIAHSAQIEARGLPDGGLELELRFASVAAGKPPVGGFEPVSG